jgi:hypothetical protein
MWSGPRDRSRASAGHEISTDARAYPADLLPEGGTALALFAAAFLGANDAIHFARKDMYGTCVDIDEKPAKREMAACCTRTAWIVPRMRTRGSIASASRACLGKWDVVSVDTFLGDATERSLASLDLWCSLAPKMVTATISADRTTPSPNGWRAQIFPRSAVASWLVLQRD